MKRFFILVLAIGAVWLAPRLSTPAMDVGKLEPVEAVHLTKTAGALHVETDSGSVGQGKTLAEAVADLQNGASAQVFLGSADKLLVTGDMTEFWPEIFEEFRPACQVCVAEERVDLAQAAAYLDIHPTGLTLTQLRGGKENWQRLVMEEGRGRLVPN